MLSIPAYEEMQHVESISDGEEDIEEAEGGRYKASFHIAKTYFPYIIGSKGATRKRLETETRTRILIPKQGHDGDIVVTGATKKCVASARRRIRLMVLSSRKRQALTHFISIPLTGPSFQNGLLSFKSEVLSKCNDRGINENIFQTPERLHLTISVLVLCDEVERNEAAKLLDECKESVVRPLLNGNKLRVVMCGIDIMNDDPSETSILFGKCVSKNDDVLQDVVDSINTFFTKKGLIDRKRDHIKIHATLMNTTFLHEDSEEDKNKNKRETFDARNIMENFQDYYFGEEDINSIELSMFHSSSKTEYYQSTASIDIS